MTNDFVFPTTLAVDAPNLADHFGLWAIEGSTFEGLVARCQGLNLHAHINSPAAAVAVESQNARDYGVDGNGIATIRITGPTMKSVSSLSNGTSTVRVREQLRSALKSSDVRGALLVMDTPGGTVRGNEDLANEVARFAAAKPIFAYIEDLTASAGVSVASQATKRFANSAAALYGSMGVYSVLEDLSGRAEQLGIKVHVVRAGAHKGAGEPGTPITSEHLAEAQRIVDALNENYLGIIASGLKKDVAVIRELADGRIHPAAWAVENGLIDGISSLDKVYEQLVAATRSSRTITPAAVAVDHSWRNPMENAATLAELKAAFPKSTADWRETQMESGATIAMAAVAYAGFVESQAATERDAHAEEIKKLKAVAPTPSIGHEPVRARGQRRTEAAAEGDEYLESGDPIEDFNAAVAKLAGPRPDLQRRQRAIRTVAANNPELYQSYLLATNPGRRQARLITEKLEAIAK